MEEAGVGRRGNGASRVSCSGVEGNAAGGVGKSSVEGGGVKCAQTNEIIVPSKLLVMKLLAALLRRYRPPVSPESLHQKRGD